MEAPYQKFSDAPFDLIEYAARENIEVELLGELEHEFDIEIACKDLIKYLKRPGVYLEVILCFYNDGEIYEPYDVVQQTKMHRDADLSILESLGVIRRVALSFDHRVNGKEVVIKVHYSHITQLGVAFCEVCCRQRVRDLKAMDERSRAAS